MSADKHPAAALAFEPLSLRGADWHDSADELLRRIPALEAERDRIQKANDGQTRLNITLVMENKELIAERDRLTAILERWADASAPDGWIGQMIVDRDKLRAEVQRWSVLAASFEAERNLLRAELEALRDDCENARRLARLVCDALNVPILHDAPAAIEALRADAERYRWLIDKGISGGFTVVQDDGRKMLWHTGPSLTQTIDAARKQQ